MQRLEAASELDHLEQAIHVPVPSGKVTYHILYALHISYCIRETSG